VRAVVALLRVVRGSELGEQPQGSSHPPAGGGSHLVDDLLHTGEFSRPRLVEDLHLGVQPVDFVLEPLHVRRGALGLVPEPASCLAELFALAGQGRQLVTVCEEGFGPG